ncbi:MAG: isochorismatase family protein [Phycisphaerales bacterium]|nr:isochorismatase family protein [Phycisphaerales bacterium]
MPISRLVPAQTALLVVDVQTGLLNTIHNGDRTVRACRLLAQAASTLDIPVCVTEHYVKGLGSTVPGLAQDLAAATRFDKTKFSAFIPEVHEWLNEHRRPRIVVCGWEAHVCILQTVLDLAANGWQPFHATDAISSGDATAIEPAFRRMEMAGSTPTGSMSVVYELLGDATHPKFRACLALVKSNAS